MLDKDQLKKDIKKALIDAGDKAKKSEDPVDFIAEQLANAIDSYVKSAEVEIADDVKIIENILTTWVPVPMDGGAVLKSAYSATAPTLQKSSKLR
jgi:hypothetical protein